ncbi:hypothetical protein RZS08_00925, partial [Arthrospira platensis SPKY1]|nr:hypothetical protein [Arthrospira platensis SPKY1]
AGWNVEIDPIASPDYWNYGIHAETGELINIVNYTQYCSFDINSFNHTPGQRRNHQCNDHTHIHSANPGNSSYLVFPLPAESPSHGAQTIAEGPFDSVASPFG